MAEPVPIEEWIERWKRLAAGTKTARIVVIDIGTCFSGWPGLRVYFEPPLEPDQGWRCIEAETHAEAMEVARNLSAGELRIVDKSGGRNG